MPSKSKITVVGAGYVGMSLSVLLAQHNDVVVLDLDANRVNKINNKRSTVLDAEINYFLENIPLSLRATLDKGEAYQEAEYIFVATPTDFNPETNYFDTSSVDQVVEDALALNKQALVVIKSTVPVGHTKELQTKFNTDRVIFSPEFLREGQALNDNLYPSRIIIGYDNKPARKLAKLLEQAAKKENIDTLFMGSTEAEAVKLFANTYLAMRVSFFNELDTYTMALGLDTKSVIDGVCLDERIGDSYNNPSFGYGGYCLPKDTKQLLSHFQEIPQDLIKAIVSSNSTRKRFIVDEIVKQNPKTVGFYRLVMKEGSDNFRFSAVQDIISHIKELNLNVIIFEPSFDGEHFDNVKVSTDLEEFKIKSDLIVANRLSDNLIDVKDKVFTRDIFRLN